MATSVQKSTLLLGATGETGKKVLKELQKRADVAQIKVLTRRMLPEFEGIEKVTQRVVDFDNLSAAKDEFANVDIAFCALGTTRAKAGAKGFVKVDHDYVLNSAQQLKEQSGASAEFHLVTAVGADPNAWGLYSQTKGRVEEAVKALNFGRTVIYRPKVLLTSRDDTRYFEAILQSTARTFDCSQSWSLTTEALAKAITHKALGRVGGGSVSPSPVETLEHDAIVLLSKQEGAE